MRRVCGQLCSNRYVQPLRTYRKTMTTAVHAPEPLHPHTRHDPNSGLVVLDTDDFARDRACLAAFTDALAALERQVETRLTGVPDSVSSAAEKLGHWLTDSSYARRGLLVLRHPSREVLGSALAMFSQLENLDFMDSALMLHPDLESETAQVVTDVLEDWVDATRAASGRTKDLRFVDVAEVPQANFSALALPVRDPVEADAAFGGSWCGAGIPGVTPAEWASTERRRLPSEHRAEVVNLAAGHGGLYVDPMHSSMMSRGFRLVEVERRSALVSPVGEPPALPDGLRALRWTGLPRSSADMRGLLAILGIFSTDVPKGDGSFEDEVITEDRLRNNDASLRAAGQTAYWTALVTDDGTFAAATVFHVGPQPVAAQQETVTHPSHRGQGLARLVKLHNAAFLRAHLPDVTVVQTYNAAENDAMLAVNNSAGFVPVSFVGLWERG